MECWIAGGQASPLEFWIDNTGVFRGRCPDVHRGSVVGDERSVRRICHGLASWLQATVRSKLVRKTCFDFVHADRPMPRKIDPTSPTPSTASAAHTTSPDLIVSTPTALASPFQSGAFVFSYFPLPPSPFTSLLPQGVPLPPPPSSPQASTHTPRVGDNALRFFSRFN